MCGIRRCLHYRKGLWRDEGKDSSGSLTVLSTPTSDSYVQSRATGLMKHHYPMPTK